VVSDAHEGLKCAIEAVLTGAAWQRCGTHAGVATRELACRHSRDVKAWEYVPTSGVVRAKLRGSRRRP